MRSLKRSAILLSLARQLIEKGNWCGETHLQKATYILQDLAGVDTGYDFVLYKHGPFSFDLRDEITSFRADSLLELQVQPQPYGPKLIPTQQAKKIEAEFPNTLAKKADRIKFIVEVVGDKGVSELERLATALFITRREMAAMSKEERAARLHEVKPHISKASALEAMEQIDDLLKKIEQKSWIPASV